MSCAATREYQKEAIRTTLRFLLGGNYANLRELAKENFDDNEELSAPVRFMGQHGEDIIQLPGQLSCSIDQATATGKSWVLYGIAAILLAEGAVDRVLVLCPSNTIESGLMEKFSGLGRQRRLAGFACQRTRRSLPQKSSTRPKASWRASICVENYHAILEHVKSSIRDSLKGKGSTRGRTQ